MYTFIVVLLIIVSIVLALLVLVQNSKGGGLASGLNASNQVMGVRKTTDILEKLTWGFAVTLIVLALAGNFALPKGGKNAGNKSKLQNQIENLPSQQAPAGGQGAPAGAAKPGTPSPAGK